MIDREKTIEDLKQLAKDDWILHFNDTDVKETAKSALALLKEQENRIKDLEEKLRIDISLKERNDNFDLYDTPIFGFHD